MIFATSELETFYRIVNPYANFISCSIVLRYVLFHDQMVNYFLNTI